jgi:hypothetical protein
MAYKSFASWCNSGVYIDINNGKDSYKKTKGKKNVLIYTELHKAFFEKWSFYPHLHSFCRDLTVVVVVFLFHNCIKAIFHLAHVLKNLIVMVVTYFFRRQLKN